MRMDETTKTTMETKTFEFDEDFLIGVSRTSALFSSVMFVFLLGFGFSQPVLSGGWAIITISIAMGFGAGAVASTVAFELLRQSVNHLFPTGDPNPSSSTLLKTGYVVALLLKFPALCVYMYFVLSSELFHLVGVMAGLGVPQLIMFLQVLGKLIVETGDDAAKHTRNSMNFQKQNT